MIFTHPLPTFTLETVSNTVFVVVGEQATDAEDKDFWLFELSVLPLSVLLFVVIGKGVLVDVDEFAAKSDVKVVVAVAMDEGWDEEGNWLLISLAVTLLSFIELAPIALAVSSSISANNYIFINLWFEGKEHLLHNH